MAKRKRLSPAQPVFLDGPVPGQRAPETKSMPLSTAPIAQVAGDASARAALDEMSQAMAAARAQGRMIELLPLDVIDERHLVRDRLEQNEEEMAALVDSLRARGQQMPVEVVPLPDPAGGRTHGLISGWRRLTALRRLYKETSDPKFATIRAMVIAPETAQDAYVAMVEENEIRVNLSHYERARIAVRAMKEGVYPSQRAALQGLFGNTTRSRRSKIGTFILLVEAFDAVLYFPSAISEKLGLALAREMVRDPGFADALKERLVSSPRDSAGAEMQILSRALAERQMPPAPVPDPVLPERPRLRSTAQNPASGERIVTRITKGIEMRFTPDQRRIELVGEGVSDRLAEMLEDWLKSL
ncbi:ParB/RepB/Spo0J family partition protein [Ruegeria marina]|uniref:ParB-like nuclease domain-containing protein n=1 Tax=Ruegeria marina TaxID=639004 RepID=A0A1G7E6J7_9RHOB|nr:ParB N-terminal domain-containing protein [Ruegeria marina]SDE59263.1 ParB-like nuclease domain-containing protein [Ruegeria marina]